VQLNETPKRQFVHLLVSQVLHQLGHLRMLENRIETYLRP
jgi:hypothetical protein